MSHHDTLVKAFRALDDEQRGNLLWHAENGTRIYCGANYSVWRDGNGAG